MRCRTVGSPAFFTQHRETREEEIVTEARKYRCGTISRAVR
jgi:hypothetical protein